MTQWHWAYFVKLNSETWIPKWSVTTYFPPTKHQKLGKLFSKKIFSVKQIEARISRPLPIAALSLCIQTCWLNSSASELLGRLQRVSQEILGSRGRDWWQRLQLSLLHGKRSGRDSGYCALCNWGDCFGCQCMILFLTSKLNDFYAAMQYKGQCTDALTELEEILFIGLLWPF